MIFTPYFTMLPEISEIKAMRKRLGLTQAELARLNNVSQSFMAKAEAGDIVPAYDKAKRIFDCLEKMQRQSSAKAKDVMRKRIFFVNASDSVKKAISILEKHGLSQMPVLENGKNTGLVSERGLLGALSSGKLDIAKTKVRDIMEEALPTISEDMPLSLVSEMLSHNLAVLVTKHGKTIGIITKSDILQEMLK